VVPISKRLSRTREAVDLGGVFASGELGSLSYGASVYAVN